MNTAGTVAASPKVSIGLPVNNGERYLAAALDSLLAQTFADFELIISDNASTDGARTICEDYARRDERVRYFRERQNTGAIRNHNRTIELSVGTYFKWAAHDDVYGARFLERCVHVLDTTPEAVLAFSRTQFIDESGRALRDYHHPLKLSATERGQRFLCELHSDNIPSITRRQTISISSDRCLRGAIFDVIIDPRPTSQTYTRHVATTPDRDNGRALFILPGVAHGFQTLVDDTEVSYSMTDYFEPTLDFHPERFAASLAGATCA